MAPAAPFQATASHLVLAPAAVAAGQQPRSRLRATGAMTAACQRVLRCTRLSVRAAAGGGRSWGAAGCLLRRQKRRLFADSVRFCWWPHLCCVRGLIGFLRMEARSAQRQLSDSVAAQGSIHAATVRSAPRPAKRAVPSSTKEACERSGRSSSSVAVALLQTLSPAWAAQALSTPVLRVRISPGQRGRAAARGTCMCVLRGFG